MLQLWRKLLPRFAFPHSQANLACAPALSRQTMTARTGRQELTLSQLSHRCSALSSCGSPVLRYRQLAFMSAGTLSGAARRTDGLRAPLSSAPGANAGLCCVCAILPAFERSRLKLASGYRHQRLLIQTSLRKLAEIGRAHV